MAKKIKSAGASLQSRRLLATGREPSTGLTVNISKTDLSLALAVASLVCSLLGLLVAYGAGIHVAVGVGSGTVGVGLGWLVWGRRGR